ncbi:MAG: hypothetical protein ABI472_07290 [Ginsengibacter sp.]
MAKRLFFFAAFIMAFLLYSCSKKTHPSKTTEETTTTKTDSVAVKKAIAKRNAKVPLPNVIAVNDSAARKSVDGRYYYDVMGHRYWRNNKDGKYYLFNKSMYNDPAFQKPN